LYKSTDAGLHWTSAPGLHGDEQSLAFAPADSKTVYVGDDGGLWKSTSGADSFRSLNATLSLAQIVGLCVHPFDPAIAYIGTQDNGTQRRQGNTGLWEEFSFGDGGQCVVDPIDPGVVFTSSIAGRASRWTNNTKTFGKLITTPTTFGEDKTFRIGFYPPFNGNGVDQTLYFGTWRLFKSIDLGDTWSAPAAATDLTKGGRDVLSAIGVARSNTNVIYTGSAGGRAMVTTDGGVNWTDVTAGLPNRFIDSLTVNPANSSIAYLTVSGYGSGHVFKTTNTGASWTDVSGNLPNAPTSALLLNPNDSQTIYAGTDIGVFRSITGGTTWETFNNGMPPVTITALAAQANGHIQAATYGRGVYELVTTASGNFSMAAAPAKQFVPAGGKITYTINTATISGSPQTIDLSVSGLPANTTASFNPASITSGASSTLTINIASNTLTADYTLGVTGTGSGGISHYVPLTLSVSASLLNSIDDVRYFVRQQYLDFLNREPDAGGLAYWMQQIAQCGADQACVNRKRVDVSAAFFIEQEFQDTGSFVYRFHKASYGQVPTYARFIADRSKVIGGANLEAGKQAFTDEWIQRPEFLNKYPATLSPGDFIDQLIATVKTTTNNSVDLSANRAAYLNTLQQNGRGGALRQIADDAGFKQAEYNNAFVLMQYFGYLGRDPDADGYKFWLDILNNRVPNNYRSMVCAFITSAEYQYRFSSVRTRNDSVCGQIGQ